MNVIPRTTVTPSTFMTPMRSLAVLFAASRNADLGEDPQRAVERLLQPQTSANA